MPKSTKRKLDYQATYNNRPEQVKRQTLRKAARREAIKNGTAKVGDGKDVAHKVALDNGGDNNGNTAVVPRSKNRAWRKGSGYKVPNGS